MTDDSRRMHLKPVTALRGADILDNAAHYLKDSLRPVGPMVHLPRHYVERLERDLRRVSAQLMLLGTRYLLKLDKANEPLLRGGY